MTMTLKLIAATIVVPYLLGWAFSSFLLPIDYFSSSEPLKQPSLVERKPATESRASEDDYVDCDGSVDSFLFDEDGHAQDPFSGLKLVVHLNGDPESCGSSSEDTDIVLAMKSAAGAFEYCPHDYDNFDFEAFLTVMLSDNILAPDKCKSPDDSRGAHGLYGYCDMGEDRTPVLLDHGNLVPVLSGSNGEMTLPCHFHTREGLRISSMDDFVSLSLKAQAAGTCEPGDEECPPSTAELHLYAVPAGRVFVFAPSHVGEIFELSHVEVDSGLPVTLEVMSVSPRVFDIHNFFDRSESESLIQRALEETSDTHKLKRSTTGTSSNSIFAKRTSESGFDTHGETAMKVKRRCMSVLGWSNYIEGHTDGLQILRYNLTKAYIPHMDYLEADSSGAYNYDSAGVGGNRYATILLYMSDLDEEDGGETVFAHGWPVGQPEDEHVELPQALKDLRDSGDAAALTKGSWEEEMVAQCRSRLAIRPNSARAVLFYSQNPDGTPDEKSLHGGCPVLRKEKWAANLWAWNAPREGYEGAPYRDGSSSEEQVAPTAGPPQLKGRFINSGKDPEFKSADLYYEGTYWGPIGHGDPPLLTNTYEGHKWNVRVDGKVVKEFTIGDDHDQTFTI